MAKHSNTTMPGCKSRRHTWARTVRTWYDERECVSKLSSVRVVFEITRIHFFEGCSGVPAVVSFVFSGFIVFLNGSKNHVCDSFSIVFLVCCIVVKLDLLVLGNSQKICVRVLV